ncbi:hypothetical protein F443_17447 [Phytophthora nicotianae P1569]|uniref:HAT C-terminal dimerisation domain-containing protein n=1 Tax=Phytophthora nicotianae P1569 TaxID=1317065 RepID=V9ED73_PHYNI|nr:hypothetical protein F443_17447 [Phytophthora nicotianae P1569]
MVRDVRPDSTFSNSKVTGFYFRPYRNEYDEAVLEYSRCCCGAVRKQTNRSGYYTLMQHVLRQFPGHESVMLQATTAETGSVLNFVSHSSRNLYGWLDAMDHRVQPPILVLRASRGKTETLCLGVSGVTRTVERTIAWELPRHFGVMMDEIPQASENYVAWDSATVLPGDYGVQTEQCRFSRRGQLHGHATLMEVPLVGRSSHRLNRAVQHDLAQHECNLTTVQILMIKLRILTQSANFGHAVTRAENAAQLPFAKPANTDINSDTEDETFSFVERHCKRRRLELKKVPCGSIITIPPTLNAVERFFSMARVTLGQQRHGILPSTLEMILFLRKIVTIGMQVRSMVSVKGMYHDVVIRAHSGFWGRE